MEKTYKHKVPWKDEKLFSAFVNVYRPVECRFLNRELRKNLITYFQKS